MHNYRNEYLTIKRNLKYFKGCDNAKERGLFLLRVLRYMAGGMTIANATARLGRDRRYFYFWMGRMRACGFQVDCLAGKSTKPKNSPNRTKAKILKLAKVIRADKGMGGHNVAVVLGRDYGIPIAGSTVCLLFRDNGISNVYEYRKVNGHKKRYSCENPLETVQIDSAESGFCDANGNKHIFFAAIDDCSRATMALVCDSKSSPYAVDLMQNFIVRYGKPACVQSDNGGEFTYLYLSRLNTRREERERYAAFEEFLMAEKIEHRLIKKRTPEHNGKVERVIGTIKRYLQATAKDGWSTARMQAHIDQFLKWYNEVRPHTSLKKLTPHQKFYGPRLAKVA